MGRRRTTNLLTAVLLSGLALHGCGGEPERTAAEPVTPESRVLELTVADPSAAQAKCMVPNAEVLATQDTAFEGTVTEVADGRATLTVEQWFTGGSGADTVTVSTPGEQLPDLLVAVDFQEGRTYLVSSLDGRVSLCGFSAESTPHLEQLYAEAFAG